MIVSLSVSPFGRRGGTRIGEADNAASETHHRSRERQIGSGRRLIEQTAEHLAAAGVYIALRPVDDVSGEFVQIVEFLVGQIAQIDNMTHGELHPFHVFCFISYHSRTKKKESAHENTRTDPAVKQSAFVRPYSVFARSTGRLKAPRTECFALRPRFFLSSSGSARNHKYYDRSGEACRRPSA